MSKNFKEKEIIGILPDGTYVPLTSRQKIFYKTPLERLQAKIRAARNESYLMTTDIIGFSATEDHLKNEYLIQHFVLGIYYLFSIIMIIFYILMTRNIIIN
jgi:hypothetical protein